jgi:hypothetical protein
MRCELRCHGEWGWECQTTLNGRFYSGHRFDLHGQAVDEAERLRGELVTAGWLSLDESVHQV